MRLQLLGRPFAAATRCVGRQLQRNLHCVAGRSGAASLRLELGSAHAGSRTWITSTGGLHDAATERNSTCALRVVRSTCVASLAVLALLCCSVRDCFFLISCKVSCMGRGGALPGPACKTILSCMGGGGLLESMQTQDAFVGKLAWILKCQGLGKWADIEFVFFTGFH